MVDRDSRTILIGQFYFITLLYFQSELFKKSAMEKEMNELNLLYERQRQQYQVARQNVQIINKRCHELKVQIANLRKLSPEAVPPERIDEAERAARLYDANRNTGNEVLDVVLTEKSLLCESRGIQLNAVANGMKLEEAMDKWQTMDQLPTEYRSRGPARSISYCGRLPEQRQPSILYAGKSFEKTVVFPGGAEYNKSILSGFFVVSGFRHLHSSGCTASPACLPKTGAKRCASNGKEDCEHEKYPVLWR